MVCKVQRGLGSTVLGAMLGFTLMALPQTVRAEAPAAQVAETAQPTPANKALSLDALLRKVKAGWREESAENTQREQAFLQGKNRQAALLREAQNELAALEKRSEGLERGFEQNEVKLAELEETLRVRLGTMGELFGVIRQVAGDTRSQVEASLVSAELPGRVEALETLAQSKALPSIAQLENLWFVLQQEMIESGRVSRFNRAVTDAQGQEADREVVRVGTFNAVADGRFLRWAAENQKLVELTRQPESRYLATAGDLQNAQDGVVRFAVDPSRGSILSLLVQTPSFMERLEFGGTIGYIIIGLGLLAVLVALARILYLSRVNMQVGAQVRDLARPKDNNPLGRILQVHALHPHADRETLEHRLDEAVLKETSRLERFSWAVKVVSVVAPLMGLLGTVTGMIRTFQAITLFGTGDPKLMAGGISEALVTTMLGLVVAIPLVLLHSWLSSMVRSVVNVLDEQSAGLIAVRSEQQEERHDAAA